MHILSPSGIAQTLFALAGRPFRHRRHSWAEQDFAPPTEQWWTGDDRWSPRDTPPRHGNRLTPLVDGQVILKEMYEAMDAAQTSIYIVIWFLSPEFRMIREGEENDFHQFLSIVARKAETIDVRIVLWPGSMVGKCSARKVKKARQTLLAANPKIKVLLDTHEHLSHCHHQKALVIDERLAYVGGIDPTLFDVDRWDTSIHPFRSGLNWHDVHWRLEGPCVADVAANFAQRWNASRSDDPVVLGPPPAPLAGGVDAQVQRTVPRGIYSFAPGGIFGIAHAYRHAIRNAKRFIYMENQYLWSPDITNALCEAIERGKKTGLRIALMLPAHPNVGKSDSDRHIQELLDADAGAGVFRAYTLYTSEWNQKKDRYQYRPVYVHAKVAVIDDQWATAGSANLNGRGMATDTEINVSVADGATAQALRLRLWSEHLACTEDELRSADPIAVLDGRWRQSAETQKRTVEKRSGLLAAPLYPYPFGSIDADFGPGELEAALLDR